MIRIREAIVVEGRYDKALVASLVDTVIVETRGFGIFKDRERLAYLRLLAEKRGLLVLTDADGAGFLIRGFLKSSIPADRIRQAYIPALRGKERRKEKPSKEGLLGVEGMSGDVILESLRRAGVQIEGEDAPGREPLSMTQLYELGLAGRPNSAARRKRLEKALGLPEYLSSKSLCEALPMCCTVEELEKILSETEDKEL